MYLRRKGEFVAPITPSVEGGTERVRGCPNKKDVISSAAVR